MADIGNAILTMAGQICPEHVQLRVEVIALTSIELTRSWQSPWREETCVVAPPAVGWEDLNFAKEPTTCSSRRTQVVVQRSAEWRAFDEPFIVRSGSVNGEGNLPKSAFVQM